MKNIRWNEMAFWLVVWLLSSVLLVPLVLLAMWLLDTEVDSGKALIISSILTTIGVSSFRIYGSRIDVPDEEEK